MDIQENEYKNFRAKHMHIYLVQTYPLHSCNMDMETSKCSLVQQQLRDIAHHEI